MCLKDPWSWPAAILLFLLPLWCWEMLPHVVFFVFLHLFRNFGLLFPFQISWYLLNMWILVPRESQSNTSSVSQAVPVPTNYKLIFLLSGFFFPESSWPHLSHKWSLLIRARTWWASNLIFADNSFSTSGICWLVWCSVCFGLFFEVFFFPSFCSWVSAAGKSLSWWIYFLWGSWFLSIASYQYMYVL